MKYSRLSILSFIFLLSGCITQFIPQTTEDKQLMVVEGLITNKPEANKIRLTKSHPLGIRNEAKPVSGCTITVTDDNGSVFAFNESEPGIYVSDPAVFQGVIGRFYTLHINSGEANNNFRYESYPVELKPVPDIDSIYYERVLIENGPSGIPLKEGANIFLDTHDDQNKCKFFRWEYSETWEFHLPYMVPNAICWLSNNSSTINIKNASVFAETKIDKYLINSISNESDRLSQKYSILVNQYSLTEDEYLYWEKLENIAEQVGGLYDMIPASIPSNVTCLNDPNEKVLGYFSVSATSSKRIFIKDSFAGTTTPYTKEICIADTVWNGGTIPSLGTYVWVIVDHPLPPPSYVVTTRIKGCYDCTLRGTNIMPDFWNDDKIVK
jgi:hypothetical protein